jgi:hypothetical protein
LKLRVFSLLSTFRRVASGFENRRRFVKFDKLSQASGAVSMTRGMDEKLLKSPNF